jgi:hypothetical protein
MRRDSRGRSFVAVTMLSTATWVSLALPVLAATPSPTAGAGGDPRSSGQGPGLVGDPVLAIVVVLAIGLAAVALTAVYLRLTARRGA